MGRFLEIGKRDFVHNTQLGLRPFARGISFHSIDVDQVLRYNPALARRLLEEVMDHVEQRVYRPLPHRVFTLTQAVDALRCMQQSRHIGKIVVSMSDSVLNHAESATVRFPSDATYLITGGLGGVGLALAARMTARGARHFVLVGRRGAASQEAVELFENLRRNGAEIVVKCMDVADELQVNEVFDEIERTMPPLRGVFHAALVLDDGILLQLDRTRLMRVMKPKINGAWNLHRRSLRSPLDHFVLFSSISSLLGTAGQANYAAACAFLDAIAQYRHSFGLPAISINWGAIAGVGYVARHSGTRERLAHQGVQVISIDVALDLMEVLLAKDVARAAVLDVDWRKWKTAPGRIPSKLEGLGEASRVNAAAPPSTTPSERVSGASAGEQKQIMASRLCQQVAEVLGTATSSVDAEKSLSALGLDSLMAVDLRIRIEREFGASVPVMELLHGRSVSDLAECVLNSIDQIGILRSPVTSAQVNFAGARI